LARRASTSSRISTPGSTARLSMSARISDTPLSRCRKIHGTCAQILSWISSYCALRASGSSVRAALSMSASTAGSLNAPKFHGLPAFSPQSSRRSTWSGSNVPGLHAMNAALCSRFFMSST
jgi:hypothetical protein